MKFDDLIFIGYGIRYLEERKCIEITDSRYEEVFNIVLPENINVIDKKFIDDFLNYFKKNLKKRFRVMINSKGILISIFETKRLSFYDSHSLEEFSHKGWQLVGIEESGIKWIQREIKLSEDIINFLEDIKFFKYNYYDNFTLTVLNQLMDSAKKISVPNLESISNEFFDDLNKLINDIRDIVKSISEEKFWNLIQEINTFKSNYLI